MAFWIYPKTPSILPRHVSLYREDMGLDVYLCGSGPSLKDVSNEDIRVPGALIVGITHSYPHIRPDIHICMDDPSCMENILWSEPFMKILRGGFQERTFHGIPMRHMHNLYYADCRKWDKSEEENIFINKPDTQKDRTVFYWNQNSIGITLHMLLYMGAKRIHLLGSDLDNSKEQYYDSSLNKPDDEIERGQGAYNEIFRHYKFFAETAPKYGVEIISCSPDSKINEIMPYIDLNLAVENTKRRKNLPVIKPLTGKQAEALHNKGSV